MVMLLDERFDIPKVDVNGFSYKDAKKNADAATKRDGYDNAVLLSPDGSFSIARLGYDGKPVGWEPEGTRILYVSKSDWGGGVHKAIGTEISQDTLESRSVSNSRSKRLNEGSEELYESDSKLFGVRLYDPYSGEYVVYWSQDRNIVREIYDTLRDHTWIRYDDLYDFVDQINPKFNKFTWGDIGFEWDGDDAFIGDGVHESEGEIDIIYELPLDTKHYAESISRRRGSNESMRRTKRRSGLREGDASLKTNYAVIVYDMNTASYNLYTGTKKMCEQLYKDLVEFHSIDDYDDDEKEDMYDWLYGRLNELNCIERIDFRRGIDYRDNYSDGYNKYHIINYTKPRHPISLYL